MSMYCDFLFWFLGNNVQLNESVPVSAGNQNANFNVLIMLQPADYSVTVAAVNENGQGTPSEAINISLIIDIPSKGSMSKMSTLSFVFLQVLLHLVLLLQIQ